VIAASPAERWWFENELSKIPTLVVELKEINPFPPPPTPLFLLRSSHTSPTTMFPLLWPFLFFAFGSTAVLACEGECMVNVTRFVLRSYSNPVYDAFQAIVCHSSPALSFHL
jgi:hypothetical protein